MGASAGQVIQVITATDSTQRSTSSSSFVTGSNTLSVTITPSAAANKIFVTMSSCIRLGGANPFVFTIQRGATNLGNGNDGMAQVPDVFPYGAPIAMSILDSPNTTSATTYQFFMRNPAGVDVHFLNASNSKGTLTCFEIKG